MNEKTVLVGHAHYIADHAGIVDDIVMSEHHAFGKARGPRCVLHIDDILIIEGIHPLFQCLIAYTLPRINHLSKFEHPWRVLFFTDIDNIFHQW